MRAPRKFNQYLYPGDEHGPVYTGAQFCPACDLNLGDTSSFPQTTEEFTRKYDGGEGRHVILSDKPLRYFSFCPWCGTAFDAEWWRDQIVENERVIDHYRDPGTHKGDTHQFTGSMESGPDVVGHILGSSDGSPCWCGPEIEPGLLGCTIRHSEKTYAQYEMEREARFKKWRKKYPNENKYPDWCYSE